MRKSQPQAGSRHLRAGLAVAATAAAVVAGTAVPAWAVGATGLLDTTTGPVGGGISVKLTTTGHAMDPATYTAAKARFSTSCDGQFGTTSTTKPEATVSLDATSKDDATVTVPALAAGTYKMCVYGGTSVTSTTALIASSSNSLVLAAATTTPTLSPSAGTSAGGTSVTATGLGPYLATGGTTLGVTFRTTSCSSTYSATSPIVGTTGTKNTGNTIATFTVPTTLPAAGSYNVCIYAGTTANTSALLGSASYAALPTSTVSPASGNSGGLNTIVVTTRSAAVTASPAAVFTTSAACPATYDLAGGSDVTVSSATKISTTKAAITVPAGVVYAGSGETTQYNVCLYATNGTGASAKLLAVPTTYSVATALDLTGTTITPSGGPSQGNSTITVDVAGGIPTNGGTLTASLGTSPLTIVSVVSDTEFTATTSAHAAGADKLTVTTAAGSQTTTGTVFTFSYGISVSPTTAAPSSTVTLDILGSGFDALTFATSAEATNSTPPGNGVGVFLVDNGWFAAMDTANSVIAAGLESQCMGVTKISDNELICTLDLTKSSSAGTGYYAAGAVPSGVYNVAVVNDSDALAMTGDSNVSRISSGSVFTVAAY